MPTRKDTHPGLELIMRLRTQMVRVSSQHQEDCQTRPSQVLYAGPTGSRTQSLPKRLFQAHDGHDMGSEPVDRLS